MKIQKSLLKDSFFDDINGHSLDKYQRTVILNNTKEILVVAGAGSGKTLTIIGKVKYLIEKLGYQEKEILCLSFTNETVNNLNAKLGYQKVDVLTFHKLALSILKENRIRYSIANDNFLSFVVNEYFYSNIVCRELVMEYFNNFIDYDELICHIKLEFLKSNIVSFIKKIKCYDMSISYLRKISKKCLNDKEKIFLIWVFDILRIYQEELLSENKIDFDDMIIYAKDIVKKMGIKKKYRYIIIDEYQDISLIRFHLIQEILKKTKASLMCVGDDYQSIYGFSGSSVDLFINFSKYFPNGIRLDIKNTYRNSYQLINTSIKFIMKNSYQLRKNIHATFLKKHPIILVYYDNLEKTYQDLVNYLYLENKREIMVLARYHRDLKRVEKEVPGMNMSYLTVHMAKGLESDNVILLKVSDEYLGFPSKIRNDPVFSLIDNNNEDILYAEERRLFYVALTRCRDSIYLLVPRKNPSVFIEEIKNQCVSLLLK